MRYEIEIIYKPGKEMLIADAISRACYDMIHTINMSQNYNILLKKD